MLIETVARITLDLKGQCVNKVTLIANTIHVELISDRRYKPICSKCGNHAPGYDHLPIRTWKHVPLWGIGTLLKYRPRRVDCPNCGIKVEKISWAVGKSPISIGFQQVISKLSEHITWKGVADLFDLSWNTVYRVIRNVVAYGLDHRDISALTFLGIDEISRRKGHVYHTQVYDIYEKRLIWTGQGRDGDTMKRFFKIFKTDVFIKTKGICLDMWAAYVGSVKTNIPHAVIVFDKFHLTRHLLNAVDKVRRREHAILSQMNDQILKGTKYLWLKNPWNLTDNQNVSLGYLAKLNLKVFRAYLLKESFREFWNYKHIGYARRYLDKWFWWATHSRIPEMRDFAWMLRRHENEILNYIKVPIDNGAVEGMNNKAKIISRRSYGFKSENTFRVALYHGLGQLPQPELTHNFL